MCINFNTSDNEYDSESDSSINFMENNSNLIRNQSNQVQLISDTDTDSDMDSETDTDTGSFNDAISETESEISEYDIGSDDDVNEHNYALMLRNEIPYLDEEKENNKYYLGFCQAVIYRKLILLTNSVSINTFYRYSYERIVGYLRRYSVIRLNTPKIHIMKLIILPDESYSVIIKTHWLRLVQRHWKKIFRERQCILYKRRSIQSQRVFELTARYPNGQNYLPTIYRMMNIYKT